MARVEDVDKWEAAESPDRAGKIAITLDNGYSPDGYVTVEALLELRSEIDKYLFLRLLKRGDE